MFNLLEELDELKQIGVYDEATIFFTADHGEQFLEHGRTSHPSQCYDEQLRVPLIIKDKDCKVRKVEEIVSLLDIAPTIIEFAGINKKIKTFYGQSLYPLLNPQKNKKYEEKPVISFTTH